MSAVRLSFGSRAGSTNEYTNPNTGAAFFSGGPYETVEALAEALKNEIKASGATTIPECTTVELSLAFNALIPLVRPTVGPYSAGAANDLPEEFLRDVQNVDNGSGPSRAEPVATGGSVLNVADPAQRAIVQRAASRGLISAVEAADGFRYCFNNAWAAKEEEGSRFSYICQDSLQNKDRHANGFTRTLKHLKGEGERGPRKPTYDCKGSVSVKFSSGRQSVDLYYRHYAIHATVAERKAAPRPPPRPRVPPAPKETGGLWATLQAENVASSALAVVEPPPPLPPQQPSNVGRPLKRKRESGGPALQVRDPNKPMSLMELLSQSDTANAPQPVSEVAKPTRQSSKAPVAYELPSWQTPPPPLNRPGQKLPYPAPYPPPQFRNQAHSTPTPQQRQSSGTQPAPQGLFTTMKQATWTNRSAEQVSYAPTQPSPVVFKPPQTTTSKRFTDSGAMVPRATRSCNNCRARKLKCDEGRPCNTCIRSHKQDCAYEDSAPRQDLASSWGNISQNSMPDSWPSQSQSQTSSQNQSQSTQATQWSPPTNTGPEHTRLSLPKVQNQSQREESPDPWFPKR